MIHLILLLLVQMRRRPFAVPAAGWTDPERRRSDLAHADDLTIKTTRVSGKELVVNAGEVAIEVRFPVLFVEEPSMTFGGFLDINQFPRERHFPTVSVVGLEWRKAMTDRVGGGEGAPGWYEGALLAVVTTGKADQRMYVHWGAEGLAICPPVGSAGETDEML